MTQKRTRRADRKTTKEERIPDPAVVLTGLPSPSPLRGLLPTPPEVVTFVNQWLKDRPATAEARQRITEDLKMQYYFGGHEIAYRETPKGSRSWLQVWMK
jgi:hypothetical protein